MGRGRAPCCDRMEVNKGWWTAEEDSKLVAFRICMQLLSCGFAGLRRCGKSCRLRWVNYLRPGIKHGNFTQEEEDTIIQLHRMLGNQWSKIASSLPGRTDNEIKNIWNTYLRKRTMPQKCDPVLKSGGTSDMFEAQNYSDISSSTLPANAFEFAVAKEENDLVVLFESEFLNDTDGRFAATVTSFCAVDEGKDPIEFDESQRWLVELVEELGLFEEGDGEEKWEKMVTEGGGDPVATFIGNLI